MPDSSDISQQFQQIQDSLVARWPENKIAPDLQRIAALMDFIGEPQRSAPVIHIAGTNGKTSTARIIEAVLREFGLTTGLYTSPSLDSIRERICLDGEAISEERFVAGYRDIEPFLTMLDDRAAAVNGAPVTMFEAMTALAFATFADAPVDVMIIECGMGGTWDATNIVVADITVITPIGLDHQDYLGDTLGQIATEKAGILDHDAVAVIGAQPLEAATVLLAKCVELDIQPAREGIEFVITDRTLAIGGQLLTISGLRGTYDELYLPIHGAHQADNAAIALATVELFIGGDTDGPLPIETVRAGMANASSPGRLERVRTSPTVLIDAAHNPDGANAVTQTLAESFDFSRLIAVVAVLEGKDAVGILGALEPGFDAVVVTTNSSPRSMSADELGELAIDVFGDDRVFVNPSLSQALEVAVGMADDVAEWGSSAVVALGSVVTAADVRRLMWRDRRPRVPDDARELTDDPQ